MSELSREQVEILFAQVKSYQHGTIAFKSAVEQCIAHESALRATITQQAQELERVKKLMKEREYRDEANATLQLQILADKAKRIDDLKQQLSASQARCREMETDSNNMAVIAQRRREELDRIVQEQHHTYMVEIPDLQQQLAQLQAALAGRDLRIRELDSIMLMRDATLAAITIERNDLDDTRQGLEAELSCIKATLAAREEVIGQQEATIRGYRHSIKIIGQQHDDRKAERDAAVQETGRLKEAVSCLTCEVCKMDMQRALKGA